MDIKGKVPFLRKVEGSFRKKDSSNKKGEKPSHSNKASSSISSAETSPSKRADDSVTTPEGQVGNQDDSGDAGGLDTAKARYTQEHCGIIDHCKCGGRNGRATAGQRCS